MVEAAVLFPVILVVVFGFLSLSLTLYEQVSQNCIAHGETSLLEESKVFPEDLLRSAWVLKMNEAAKEIEQQ